MFFDYATKFRTENEKIADVSEFQITDKIYSDFIEFIKSNNFTYTSDSQNKLNE